MADGFGALLRTHRLRAGLTQDALATASGVSARTISSLESGRARTPQLGSMNRLSAALAVSPAEREELLAAARGETIPTHKSEPEPALPPIPRQLPAAPRLFTGRVPELARLTGAMDAQADLGATMVISTIGGTGGIGKTWLALHWAHRNIDRFPDGQLMTNLRGFDPTAAPTSPAAALRGLLDALHVDAAAIPASFEAQCALYRSLVAGRRMLILLDNARDTAQVVSLLPGSPTCTVLVTSRDQLSGLAAAHGALSLALDVLEPAEARALLTAHLGHDRVAAEPEAVDALLDCCGGLPLALGIIAARATAHPGLPLAALAEELREQSARLDGLNTGDLHTNLRAVFASSYHALDDEAATLFRLLGAAPGPDISLPAAASLIGRPTASTRVILRSLETAHLLQQHTPGRYRMHDLVRLCAAELAKSCPARDAALRRLVDFYLHTAHAGDRLLEAHRQPVMLGELTPGAVPHGLTDQAAVQAWFRAEHACLLATHRLAVDRGWHAPVWQLAWALDTFHHRHGHLHDRVAVWRAGAHAAAHLAEPTTQVLALRLLGGACARAGDHVAALDHLHEALDLAERTGDPHGQASAHYTLAMALGRQGDHQQALDHATCALPLFRALDSPAWEADALNLVGWYSARVGRHREAREFCETALILNRQHGNPEGEANTLDSLGYIAHQTDQHDDALRYYGQALTVYRGIGHTYEEADTLDRLGEAQATHNQHDHARHTWQQALELYQLQHRVGDAERVQQRLAALDEHPHPTADSKHASNETVAGNQTGVRPGLEIPGDAPPVPQPHTFDDQTMPPTSGRTRPA
ncbi:ATP-binding protein [Solihabitans fulvus]|nr:XRE family transcriptional regulator [Solihabitans fulvus]